MHSFLYRYWWYFWEYEMLRPGLRHFGHRERRRQVRDARSYSGADAGAFLRADAGAGRPDRFSSLRADAAALRTPFTKADAAAHKQTESAAHAGAGAAPYT